ncbi:MAG: anthranilate phosphoribosyltransferase, partial [Planctomycetota bacterium]
MFSTTLVQIAAGHDLSFDQMRAAIDEIMQGSVGQEEIAALLTGLAEKGETVDEVAGAAAAMRAHMTPIRTSRTGL